MTTGWQQIDGQWYYMDQAGVMQRGWFKDNDKWYFLLPNGAMATNTVIDGRQIGADGIWIAAEGEVEPANITDLSTPYLVQNLILDEVRYLVSKGVKEFQVIAQELTYYGVDLYKKQMLPELIERISEVPGVHSSSFPRVQSSTTPMKLAMQAISSTS